MKKIFAILLINFFCQQISSAQVISTETFDGGTFPPTGWLIKPDSTPIINIWRRLTTGTNPTCNTKGGAGMARFSSRAYIGGTQQLLISRPIDYTNRTATDAANINFWMYRDSINTNYDSINVWVNSTDTLTASAIKLGKICRYRNHAIPDTQVNNGWRFYSFSIPNTFIGNTTTRIIFEGTSGSLVAGQGAQIFIDQLSFEEYPVPCTGAPNMGNIVASNPLICGGSGVSNLTLSNPSLATGLVYNWISASSPVGPYTTLGTTATVSTGTITSTTYVTCIITCSNTSLSDTTNIDSVVVITNLLPIITTTPSPAVFCAGTSGATVSASGATNYTWAPIAGLNTTSGATVIATPSGNTQYTIVGIDASGCSASATINVAVSNGPVLTMSATPNDSICIGGQTILNCIGGQNNPSNTFLWSDGTTTRRDTIIVTSTKYYSVTVTNIGGCISTDSILITALPAQTSGFTYTQVGNTITFTDTTTNPKSWSWTFGDGNSSNLKNPIYTYSAPGTYTVTLIVNGPCKRDTISKTILIAPLSIGAFTNGIAASCYPNPASDALHISIDNDIVRQVIITNLMGQQVSNLHLTTKASATTIAISDLQKGIYNVHIMGRKGKAILKFVKQ